MIRKRYEIKRGYLFYKDELEFKSSLQEFFWKTRMKMKGCNIKEIRPNKQSFKY